MKLPERYAQLKLKERDIRCDINALKKRLQAVKSQIIEIEKISVNQTEIEYDQSRSSDTVSV